MSDLQELAEDLGIDTDETKEVAESAIIVDSATQIENSNKLIEECKKIYKRGRENDLIWRWLIGEKVENAYSNENEYEKGVLKKLSEELDIAISDLSRFRKFHSSFDQEMLIDRASVGYAWSHFKMINDLPDGDIKKRMISMVEKEDEAPKTKDLQIAIAEEKNQSFEDEEESRNSSSQSDSETTSKSKSHAKPINSALIVIEKLNDYLTDIYVQEESGMDFDTDAKHDKYYELRDTLKEKLNELLEIQAKVWKE